MIFENPFFDNILVIPCYNEYKRISTTKFERILKKHQNLLIFFADDGSNDDTVQKIKPLTENNINCNSVRYERNEGKASTIRKTIIKSYEIYRFNKIGFIDADLSVSVEEYLNISKSLRKDILFCFGSRISKIDNQIQRSIYRHIVGRFYSTLLDYFFQIGMYDSQCGCKVISSSIGKQIFSDIFVSTWIFDIEIFLRLKKLNPKLGSFCREIPLKSWKEIEGSKVPITYSLNIWLDIITIYRKYSG
jgi:dolichyl-phosphate beta-glucosyltransferase